MRRVDTPLAYLGPPHHTVHPFCSPSPAKSVPALVEQVRKISSTMRFRMELVAETSNIRFSGSAAVFGVEEQGLADRGLDGFRQERLSDHIGWLRPLAC
jgi:hypothetical protein